MFDRTDQKGGGCSLGQGRSIVEAPAMTRAGCAALGLRDRISPSITIKLVAALAVIQLLMPLTSAAIISCAANCKTCWGTASTNCMSCDTGYILKSFACEACDSTCMADLTSSTNTCTSLGSDYILDANDNRCKRTITDIDTACEPGTYNANTGGAVSGSCQVCAPGKSCEVFALTASSADCQAGYYCVTRVTIRSPLEGYSSDHVVDGGAAHPFLTADPISGVTNWWIGKTSTTVNGDVCEKGHYCPSGASQMTACPGGQYCPDQFEAAD